MRSTGACLKNVRTILIKLKGSVTEAVGLTS